MAAPRYILISRHPGAEDWMYDAGYPVMDRVIPHLTDDDIAGLVPRDQVIGTLPVQMIADLTARGVEYRHIDMQVPAILRGQELSSLQMQACRAKLTRFCAVEIPGSPAPEVTSKLHAMLACIAPALSATPGRGSDWARHRPIKSLRGAVQLLCRAIIAAHHGREE